MKTTSKTVFGFISAGLLLCASGAYVLAQTETPAPKPLSPKALKKLCAKTPTDPRCAQGASGTPMSPAMASPGSSSGSMSSPSSDATSAPAPGGTAPSTAPASPSSP